MVTSAVLLLAVAFLADHVPRTDAQSAVRAADNLFGLYVVRPTVKPPVTTATDTEANQKGRTWLLGDAHTVTR